MIMVAFCSLIKRIALVINSSGFCLNMANTCFSIPASMAATVQRVRVVPSAILPIKSYLIWLVSA